MTAAPERATAKAHDDKARERLLSAALKLFANQGYSQTSTRELAEAAQVNVAAISYYFGDKAGLYRAAFFLPLNHPEPNPAQIADPTLPLADALRLFFEAFLEPLRHGEAARLCVKLRFREMLEPTGLWQEEIAGDIQPMHDALLGVLARHLGMNGVAPDEELQRLVVCITALGVHQHVARDVIDHVAPTLNQPADAADRWIETFVRLSLAMVGGEAARRHDSGARTDDGPAFDKPFDAGY
jgi:TetR/AcrR family transcriptional regulator, regulator of cefoperazone and chloramphenicol sensitivity